MSALLIKSLNLGIIDSALSWLIGALTTLFMWIVEFTIDLIMLMLADVLYELGLTLLNFVDFFQAFFNALCGMGTYWDAKGTKLVQQDPIISLISNEAVLQVFLALTIVALILLFMTTLIAMVRTEFNSEGAKNTKGNILGQALKSLFMFFMVPAACVFGIIFSSALLNMVYVATTGGENVTAGGMVWYSASYNANKLRLDKATFEEYRSNGYLEDFGGRSAESIEAVANAVDNAFKSGAPVSDRANSKLRDYGSYVGSYSLAKLMAGEEQGSTTPTYSYTNIIITKEFYSTRDMNFIVLFLGGGIALYIMFIAAFGLIIRLYKCAILFMISAPVTALTPLDGGQTFKSWRKLMIGSVCSAFAVVIAFNLVFLLIPIMSEIRIFNPANVLLISWNRLVNLIFVLTGLYTIKETSKWVASMLGIEDPLAAGSEIAGKVMGTVGKIGAVTGGAIAAGVGKRMAAKAGKKADADADALSKKMKGYEDKEAGAANDDVMKSMGYTMKDGKMVDKSGVEVMGDDKKAFDAAVQARTKVRAGEAAKDDGEVKTLRENLENSSARASKMGGFASKADGVWQNTIQKTMGGKLQKLDDFMGGSKLIGGFDQEGNISGIGGMAFKGIQGVGNFAIDHGARLFNKGRFDSDDVKKQQGKMAAENQSYVKYGGKYYHREKVLDANGNPVQYLGTDKFTDREISREEYSKHKKSTGFWARNAARTASIRAYQAGGSRGSTVLAGIHESEAAGKRMVEMTKQASDEVARLIKTLTEGLRNMGKDAFKNHNNIKGGLSDAAYQMYGQELAKLSQLAGRGQNGKSMSVQEIAAGLITGDNTAHNLQENAKSNATEMGKFYNANINMGGIHVEMMGTNLKEALQQVFSGLNIEGASLEDQMNKITQDMKKEIEKQTAELQKQEKMIKQLAVAIAKYGKRLNPGK